MLGLEALSSHENLSKYRRSGQWELCPLIHLLSDTFALNAPQGTKSYTLQAKKLTVGFVFQHTQSMMGVTSFFQLHTHHTHYQTILIDSIDRDP